MMDEKKLVQVVNMTDHTLSYSVPEMNLVRHFDPYESKRVSVEEIQALNYKRGGHVLLQHYLCVKDDELRTEFGIPTAEELPEYDYTEADVDRILLKEPIEVLEDTLDFAPEGIIELVQHRAFKLKIPDTNKRKVIYDFTGVNVDRQITLQEQAEAAMALDRANSAEEVIETEKPTTRKRRVSIQK